MQTISSPVSLRGRRQWWDEGRELSKPRWRMSEGESYLESNMDGWKGVTNGESAKHKQWTMKLHGHLIHLEWKKMTAIYTFLEVILQMVLLLFSSWTKRGPTSLSRVHLSKRGPQFPALKLCPSHLSFSLTAPNVFCLTRRARFPSLVTISK